MAPGDDPQRDHEPLEIVRRIYASWAEGKLLANGELYDPYVVYVPPRSDVDPGPYYGIEAVTGYMQRFLEQWESWRIDAVGYTAAGESVVARVRRFGEGKASGVRLEDEIFHVWTVRGGRVIRIDVIDDERDALEAVGRVD